MVTAVSTIRGITVMADIMAADITTVFTTAIIPESPTTVRAEVPALTDRVRQTWQADRL